MRSCKCDTPNCGSSPMGMRVHTHTLEQLLCHGPKSQNPLLRFNLRQAARESAERQKQLRTVTSKTAKLPAAPTHNMPSWILAFVVFWLMMHCVFALIMIFSRQQDKQEKAGRRHMNNEVLFYL